MTEKERQQKKLDTIYSICLDVDYLYVLANSLIPNTARNNLLGYKTEMLKNKIKTLITLL